MPADALRRYLQDHLAGSVAALQLMETLADHERGRPLEQKLRGLHYEVIEEQERLKAILARLDGEESSLKRATAWLTDNAANKATHSSWRFTMCLLRRLKQVYRRLAEALAQVRRPLQDQRLRTISQAPSTARKISTTRLKVLGSRRSCTRRPSPNPARAAMVSSNDHASSAPDIRPYHVTAASCTSL